jgi:hypothetical protein
MIPRMVNTLGVKTPTNVPNRLAPAPSEARLIEFLGDKSDSYVG